MKILLTNDDGIHAPGIRALHAALCREHEVVVVAPSEEKSAASHSLSLQRPLQVSKEDIGYGVGGSPADCVKLGRFAFCKDADMVVSGINRGANLGVDVHYSGTVSAAMEGAMYGVPAAAFSLFGGEDKAPDFAYAAEICLDILNTARKTPMHPGTVLNVNLPRLERGGRYPVVASPLGFQVLGEHYEQDEQGRYIWKRERVLRTNTPYSDVELVKAGNIVLTPITWDMTAHAQLPQTQALANELNE